MTQKFLFAAAAALAPFVGLSPAAHARAGQLTSLYHFNQSQNGEGIVDGTVTMLDQVLYGAASAGGSAGKGTVFKLDLGTLAESTLFSFTGGKTQGALPFGPVTRRGNAVYGSTVEGHGTGPGSNGNYTGYGTIWRLDARSGKTRVFHGFGGADGSQPYSGVLPLDGIFYGVTWYGGSGNAGTVFTLDATGTLTQLYAFPDSTIGCNPLAGVTIVGRTLYGTTSFCGAGGAGTVYGLNLDTGQASLLYSFPANPNGSAEANALVYRHGALYGTTYADGGAGSAYRIDLASLRYTLLHQFSGGADGGTPSGGLTWLDGAFYGVTESGGADGKGAIYSIDPGTGGQAVVYSFTGGTDGDTPTAGLLAGKGALYGSTLNVDSEYPNIRGALFKFVP